LFLAGDEEDYFAQLVIVVAEIDDPKQYSRNIEELIAMRIFAAGAGASIQAAGAGTLADIYLPQERGSAMGWFYLGPLVGPLIVH
jgi:MFS family permease